MNRKVSPRRARTKQKRLAPDDRRREFVAKATEFFSEEGFGGGTRALAHRLGVTQPLLYRYFPSKDDLIKDELIKDELIKEDLWRTCSSRFSTTIA